MSSLLSRAGRLGAASSSTAVAGGRLDSLIITGSVSPEKPTNVGTNTSELEMRGSDMPCSIDMASDQKDKARRGTDHLSILVVRPSGRSGHPWRARATHPTRASLGEGEEGLTDIATFVSGGASQAV